MRSGPKALVFRGALFRISELAWVKVAPLTPWQLGVKIALFVLGAFFMVTVSDAKGSWKNLEWLIGLAAMFAAYGIRGDIRVASSGDLEDSYEERGGGDRKTFNTWVTALAETENDVKLGSTTAEYFHWVNLQRVAWARPRPIVNLYPLLLPPIYLGYNWVITQNFKIPLTPILEDWSFLTFPDGTGATGLACWLIAIAGVAATVLSFRWGVEVRACGGLADHLPMSRRDQETFFEKMAGNRTEKVVTPVALKPVPKEEPAPVVPQTVGSET